MVTKEKVFLSVTRRDVLGKKVGRLRREGAIPANVYGKHVDSVALQLPGEEFRHFLKDHGRNEIIYLQLDQDERPSFIRNIQRNPVTDEILHVDFLQVSLDQKVLLEVPVHLIGTAPAVETHGGILTHVLNLIEVEALPTNIPAYLEADVSVLEDMGQSLHVSSLIAPEGVDFLVDEESVVARIDIPAAERVEEEEEELEEGEEVEGEEAEGEEGAAEGEGEKEESGGGEESE